MANCPGCQKIIYIGGDILVLKNEKSDYVNGDTELKRAQHIQRTLWHGVQGVEDEVGLKTIVNDDGTEAGHMQMGR